MRQGTTPTYTLTINGYDLTDKTVFVTIKGRGQPITLTGPRLSIGYDNGVSVIAFALTQPETLALPLGQAEVQVRFIDANGIAKATNIAPITVERILQPGVIAYDLPRRLQSLTVTPPEVLEYAPGDLMDWAGVQVIANYTDGTSADVTAACGYNPAEGETMTEAAIMRGAQVRYTEGGVTLYYVIALTEIL